MLLLHVPILLILDTASIAINVTVQTLLGTVQTLSATVQTLLGSVQTLTDRVELKPIQVKWRITGIAAKLQEAAGRTKKYESPKFDVFLNGNHKLFMYARIEGNLLGLFLQKDIAMSADKNALDIVGSSFTVSKAGLPDKKATVANWGWGFYPFLADMTPYIDDDGINVTLDLKLNKEQQQPIIL